MIARIVGLTMAVGCGLVPACQPTGGPNSALPICDESFGGIVDGRVVVTIEHSSGPPACDLVGGMRLDLVWNSDTEGEGWGGDASVARAEQEALDAGCDPEWHNDGGFWLLGKDCDF